MIFSERPTRYFLLLFIILATRVVGQDTLFTISGKVTDELTTAPLQNASVQISGTQQATSTDNKGFFKLSVKSKEVVLTFSMIGFTSKEVHVYRKDYNNINVFLLPETKLLNEVVISTSQLETVMKSKNSNVLDYDFYNGNILLITYRDDLRKSKLILINSDFDTLSKIMLPEEPKGLFKDCLGNNHVICSELAYQIFVDAAGLQLHSPETLKNMEEILSPCIASDSNNLYFIHKEGAMPVEAGFRSFNSFNHTLNYYSINKFTKKESILAEIVDEETIRKRNDEDRFEKSKQGAGLYSQGGQEFDRLFFERTIIKEIFAPLFILNKKIFIFDYAHSSLVSYSSGNTLIDTSEITFHNQKNWKRVMCADEKSGRAFAVFETNGISELREINLTTGKTDRSYKIPFTFIKKIKACDNYVYFICKGIDDYDTAYLSRLRLN